MAYCNIICSAVVKMELPERTLCVNCVWLAEGFWGVVSSPRSEKVFEFLS